MTLGQPEENGLGRNTEEKRERYKYTAVFNKFPFEFSAVTIIYISCCSVAKSSC
jgi:hypothetical protein